MAAYNLGHPLMSAALQIYDETSTGERTASATLILATERVTAREVLRRRVQQEVETFNSAKPEYFRPRHH
jgi:hypothetical protein